MIPQVSQTTVSPARINTFKAIPYTPPWVRLLSVDLDRGRVSGSLPLIAHIQNGFNRFGGTAPAVPKKEGLDLYLNAT